MKIKFICFILLFSACNNPKQETEKINTAAETTSEEKKIKRPCYKTPGFTGFD